MTFFLGALILWDMLFRSQQGITISFLEELWARNLMNLVCESAQAREFLAVDDGDEHLQSHLRFVVMGICAWLFYSTITCLSWACG